MFGRKKDEETVPEAIQTNGEPPIEQAQPFWSAVMPVMACGAGLFSDGYVNNVSCTTAEYSLPSANGFIMLMRP